LSLSAANFAMTGAETEGMLDIHMVTNDDIRKRNSYAIKIGAITNAAIELPMGGALKGN